MTGIERIEGAFSGNESIKLMAHAVVGYPDMETSERILAAMVEAGADIIEAQLPFSDPSADGRSIVEANYAALKAGSSTRACLDALDALRAKTGTPILIMSYLNPLLAYGIDALIDRMAASGLDGLIVPDYPDDEEDPPLAQKCAAAGLALVPLIAPTTSYERAESLAAASASPFLYAVMRLGVTGRKTELDPGAILRLKSLKGRTGKKIAAGFGLRERGQIEALEGAADCAIIGSALVDAARTAIEAGADPAEAAAALLHSLKG